MRVQFIKSATGREGYPKLELPRITFSGRSNVGKSSLINSLVGQKGVARTSSTPGRTQVINFFDVDGRWIFVDLPGYGFAKVPQRIRAQWEPMIEEFFQQDEHLRFNVMIVDARHEPTPHDLLMKERLVRSGIPYRIVATKIDKVPSSRRLTALDRTQKTLGESVIPYSSATGMGKKDLWQILERI